MEPDVLDYLKELRLWNQHEEAQQKLYWVALYVDDRKKLDKIFEEWKEEDENFRYMYFGSYRHWLQ